MTDFDPKSLMNPGIPTNPIAEPPKVWHPAAKPPLVSDEDKAKLAAVKDAMAGKEWTIREKADVLDKIQKALVAYDNMESNIPSHHEYWSLLGRYRAMQ